MREVLQERYRNLYNKRMGDKYLVQTSSQMKSSGVKLPKVHGVEKGLDPHIKPVGQRLVSPMMDIRHPISKPRIGQGKVGIKRKVKIVLPQQTPTPEVTQSLPETVTQLQETVQTGHKSTAQTDIRQLIGPRIETRQMPFYHELILRLPSRLPDLKEIRRDLLDLDMDRNIDFEENSAYQAGIISETYERTDRSYFIELSKLKDLIDTTKLVQKFLPKQTDIDKILDVIKRKVLKGTHLPITIIEIQAGYLTSPHFKDLYLYLAQNKLPSKRSVICMVETLVERFILLDSLLFKLVTTPDRETVLLAVPEICIDKIIMLCYTSLFAGNQGVIKTYLTISDKFFIPGVMHYLR